MKLYAHQQKIIDEDKKKFGIFTGTGTGKTRTALCLAKGKVLIIAPKTQVEDKNWEREWTRIVHERAIDVSDFPRNNGIEVISKETFRRDWNTLPPCDTLIIDEAHTVLGVTPNVVWRKGQAKPKTSQLFDAVLSYIKKHNPERIYPCTATIAKSPMTVWACAQLLGVQWNFYEFREAFYIKLPMPGKEVYSPKKDSPTKDRLAKTVRGIGYTGKLGDFFDVPDQTFKNEYIELTARQMSAIRALPMEYPEPIVLLQKKLQVENGILNGDEFNETQYFENGKIEKILEYADEFPRMIIFSRYIEQIYEIKKALLEKGKPTYVMTGETKDRGHLISELKDKDEYVFIVSAQISAGWELPECEVMIFASRTYSIVDLEQSWGRIHRANALKKNLYINLITRGGIDEAVHKCLEDKQDFSERLYLEIK